VEACGFRDLHAEFAAAGAEVLGASADPLAKLARWAGKKEFPYRFLSGEETGALERWGVWTEKSFMGKRFMGVVRATFLVGPDGRIARAWPKASPIGHAKEVLEAVRGLAGG
jgi:peroxiredoxin Q/BCP